MICYEPYDIVAFDIGGDDCRVPLTFAYQYAASPRQHADHSDQQALRIAMGSYWLRLQTRNQDEMTRIFVCDVPPVDPSYLAPLPVAEMVQINVELKAPKPIESMQVWEIDDNGNAVKQFGRISYVPSQAKSASRDRASANLTYEKQVADCIGEELLHELREYCGEYWRDVVSHAWELRVRRPDESREWYVRNAYSRYWKQFRRSMKNGKRIVPKGLRAAFVALADLDCKEYELRIMADRGDNSELVNELRQMLTPKLFDALVDNGANISQAVAASGMSRANAFRRLAMVRSRLTTKA